MIFLQFWPLEKYLYTCNEMRDKKHCTHINHSYGFTLLTTVVLLLRFVRASLYWSIQENIYNLLLIAKRKGGRMKKKKLVLPTGRREEENKGKRGKQRVKGFQCYIHHITDYHWQIIDLLAAERKNKGKLERKNKYQYRSTTVSEEMRGRV